MNHAFIFLGPSLSRDRLRSRFGLRGNRMETGTGIIEFLPPAAEGDVLRLLAEKPQPHLVGIIDGFFERVPAVWHKEILLAMYRGVHVLGASSMGALRGAELWPFGMEGIGKIFTLFKEGFLEDDDEVCVLHNPENLDYRARSDAMVNIRYTLDAAHQAWMIDRDQRHMLVQIAKRMHYKDRTYDALMDEGIRLGLCKSTLRALRAWIAHHAIDQKEADAVELIEAVQDRLKSPIRRKRVSFHFENSQIWRQARSDVQIAGIE